LAEKGLREKAVKGMFWSFSDSMATQLIQFIVGLVLARLLSPEEFGLIGMITVFIAVTQSLVDSGFGQALIRKKEATDSDFSTVFYFNFLAGVILFLVFYFSAPAIARFYEQPELTDLARVLGIIILINSASIIQRTILIRKVSFRKLMKVNFTAAVISGAIAVVMALNGFGVWSLVWRSITGSAVQAIMLWSANRWKPGLTFNRESLRSLFSFGSKLLLSGLIDTIYRNIYLLIIGKFFSAAELGYFTRADQFSRLASQNLTGTVQRVSYPVLSQVQEDDERLKAGYKKLIITTMFITFFVMLGMVAVAKPMIVTLIGDKWLPSVEFLQLICLGAMLFPLHALNLNILNVKGRSDIFLKLEVVKKLLAVPVIIAGIFLGIRAMLIGMVVLSFVAYFLNGHYSGRLIRFPVSEQIGDIMPSFLAALSVSSVVFSLTLLLNISPTLLLLLQLILLTVLMVVTGRLFRLKGYMEIRSIIVEKIPKLKKLL
jgi:O-antigen/teichoic acid export membrane protein